MTRPSSHANDLPVLLVTIAALALAILPSMAPIFPQLYWDVDPRSSTGGSHMALGPLGAAWLGVASMFLAAIALFIHALAGGKLAWKTSLLALAGIIACAYHLPNDGPGSITLCAWMGGMASAIALFHLAQHRRPRAVIIASFAALAIPWTLKSLVYVFFDHPATLAMFLENEAQQVAARGWEMGSASHLLYKRRMMFPDVTGAYGLSNVYGSIVAAIGLISTAILAWMLLHKKRTHLWLPAAMLGCSIITLYYTFSKGAMLAMLMGAGMLGIVMLAKRFSFITKIAAPLTMLGVAVVIALVLVRGAMGPPPTAEGERSLLFRFHYWQASARMLMHEPWSHKLLGIGVADHKQLYSQYKNPLNPEEVTSSHNVMTDHLTMLGVLGGGAWCILLLTWLWVSARGAAHAWAASSQELESPLPPVTSMETRAEDTLALQCVGLLAAVLFIYQFAIQWQTMVLAEQFLSWALGAAGFIAAATLLVRACWHDASLTRMTMAVLFPASALLVFHSQIEMTFFNFQSAVLALAMLSAAAGAVIDAPVKLAQPAAVSSSQPRPQWQCLAGAGVLVLAGVCTFVLYLAPLTTQQKWLGIAAEQLRANQPVAAMKSLGAAIAAMPADPRPYESLVNLQTEAYVALMQQQQTMPAQTYFAQANRTLDAASDAGVDDVNLLRQRARLLERKAGYSGNPADAQAAIDAWLKVTARTPYSLADHLHVADLQEAAGNATAAGQSYRYVLQLHDWNYLDPAKQLAEADLARVQERVGPLPAADR